MFDRSTLRLFTSEWQAINEARDEGYTVTFVPSLQGERYAIVASKRHAHYSLATTRDESVARGAIRSFWWVMSRRTA